MCFSADMSLGLGVIGFAASGVTFLDKTETFWVRFARAYAIFHFSLMEFIQYFAYPVADQCGYGTNYFLSELSTYHIAFQALAIMPALATYSSDKSALKKATLFGATLSFLFLICSFSAQYLATFRSYTQFYRQYGFLFVYGNLSYRLSHIECVRNLCYPRLTLCTGIKRLSLERQLENFQLSCIYGANDFIYAAMASGRFNRGSCRHLLLLFDPYYCQFYAVFQKLFHGSELLKQSRFFS